MAESASEANRQESVYDVAASTLFNAAVALGSLGLSLCSAGFTLLSSIESIQGSISSLPKAAIGAAAYVKFMDVTDNRSNRAMRGVDKMLDIIDWSDGR